MCLGMLWANVIFFWLHSNEMGQKLALIQKSDCDTLNTLYHGVGLMSIDALLLKHGWWPPPSKTRDCSCLHKIQPSDIPCFGFAFSLQEEPPSRSTVFTSMELENEFVKISVTIDVFVTPHQTVILAFPFGISFLRLWKDSLKHIIKQALSIRTWIPWEIFHWCMVWHELLFRGNEFHIEWISSFIFHILKNQRKTKKNWFHSFLA